MSRDAKQAYGKATWNPLALSLLLIKGISLFPPWRTKCVCGAAWTHSIFHVATLCSLSLKTPRWAGASPAQGLSQRSWKPPRGSGNIDREFLSIPRAPRSSQLSHLTCTAATCPCSGLCHRSGAHLANKACWQSRSFQITERAGFPQRDLFSAMIESRREAAAETGKGHSVTSVDEGIRGAVTPPQPGLPSAGAVTTGICQWSTGGPGAPQPRHPLLGSIVCSTNGVRRLWLFSPAARKIKLS